MAKYTTKAIGGFIFLALVIGGIWLAYAASSSTSAANDASDIQSSTPVQTTLPPQPQVLLDLTGSGAKQTEQFTAAGNWDLTWSYDCTTTLGGQGNFVVEVMNSDASPSYENTLLNQIGASASDVQHYYKGGTFYLSITSQCGWHVTVTG